MHEIIYRAPETIEKGTFKQSSNWWALGIMMYEALLGVHPLYHSSVKVMINLIKFYPVAFIEEEKTSSEMRSLIKELLNKNFVGRLGCEGGGKDILAHDFFKKTF